MDYSKTVNLPSSDFPMRANLPKREPEFLKTWNEQDIYKKIKEARKDAPEFILHDGPPYANGHLHLGHALNKTIKDIILKHKTLNGYNALYVPGWDCHGLPIELQVTKKFGEKAKTMPKSELRDECRKYAKEWVDIQREEFERLGVFGEWDNPYLTMSFDYEAKIAEVFGQLYEKGSIFRGKKPIYWCADCQTALAEAEVEYQDIKSDSIYVKFKIDSENLDLAGIDKENAHVVIWTTTPWTLPANLAVCLHPNFKYAFYKFGEEFYLLAEGMVEQFCQETELEYTESYPISVDEIAKFNVRHPFIDRQSAVIFGRHVTLEAGTGIVHTAPGFGLEDYMAGLEYGLDVYCPVDAAGKYTNEYPEMEGVHVFKANSLVIDIIRENGTLIKKQTIEHSYPHCWRCKKPLIYRATEQWFLGIDKNNLRELGLNAVNETQWIPEWGESRIRSMVESRPDWCLSRQRTWGVPIPSFRCSSCGENLMTTESINFFAEMAKKEGIDIWFTKDIKDLVPAGTNCPKCGGTHFDKEMDILDVWFDSGVSNFAVLDLREDHHWPADLYLEGSDQHRGWFQSSLWPALALRGRAPFNKVLTHGFVLDEKGRAMHKSVGNVIAPDKVIKQYGADILRLWVASEDYRNDLKIGMNMMKQIADSYRKIRNTFKFIIGNLNDYDKQAITYTELPDLDKWILHKLYTLEKDVIKAYENYEFHVVYRKLLNFCSIELSSIYFDMSKEILYTEKADSSKRRAEQFVLSEIFETLSRLIAPILVFTAEEVWQFMGKENSIHEQTYYHLSEQYKNDELANQMEEIVNVKKDILKALELKRQEKVIGTSIEADITIFVKDEETRKGLRSMGEEAIRFLQIADLKIVDEATAEMTDFENAAISASKSTGQKCARCWHYYHNLGTDQEYPDLCPRCTEAVKSIVKEA